MAAFLPLVERHGGRFLANSLAVVQGSDLGAVQVSRTLAHVSEDQPASYTDPGNALVWAFVTRGTVSVRKQRSALDTAPGAMSVQHFQRELTFQYTPDLDALSIRMDADALGLRPREVDALSSVASAVASSAQRLMWSVVSHALRAPVTASPATRAAMARSVVDFTTVFVDEFLGRLTAPEVERRNLVTEGLRHIAIHASDHRLDPARVADAVHVSLRALQKAFQAESRSIAASILEARLKRAAALLEVSPAGTTVEQIADRSGFRSAAHFSRAFRAHYDHPPGEWRHLQHADRAPIQAP